MLLHGSATGSSSWTPISASLAASGASVVAPDLIGCGRFPAWLRTGLREQGTQSWVCTPVRSTPIWRSTPQKPEQSPKATTKDVKIAKQKMKMICKFPGFSANC
jgi:hypothetical protein